MTRNVCTVLALVGLALTLAACRGADQYPSAAAPAATDTAPATAAAATTAPATAPATTP